MANLKEFQTELSSPIARWENEGGATVAGEHNAHASVRKKTQASLNNRDQTPNPTIDA
jgi:hypothetical protein